MPLVDYSSDSSDDEHKSKKRKLVGELPPLPDNFRDLYATPVRTSKVDDPSLHGGKQRVTPHIEGNPSISQRKCIQKLIEQHSANIHEIHDFLHSDLGVPSPLHISLSQSLGLKAEERHAFAEDLRSSIEQTDVHSFEVAINGVEWVSNFTRSRWFLVLHIQKDVHNDLKTLLDASNQVASRFGQKELYAEEASARISDSDLKIPSGLAELKDISLVPDDTANELSARLIKTFESFHVSIAWTLSKPSSLKMTDSGELSLMKQSLQELKVPINAVKAKIGNNILTFPMKATSSQKPSKS